MGVKSWGAKETPTSKYALANVRISPNTDKVLIPKVAPAKTNTKRPRGKQPPLWKRAAGIGNSAVWVPSLGQYVVHRGPGKMNLG